MGSRYRVRITRFNDRTSFRQVVDLLAGLYPDRGRTEFEVGLARLPCTLIHDAVEVAAEALRDSLVRRGASVLLIPVEVANAAEAAARPVASTQELSPEIDLSFLDKARKKKSKPGSSSRSRRTGPTESGRAPWEE